MIDAAVTEVDRSSSTTWEDVTVALEFYTNPMSRGQIVHWMLEEVGQPYDTKWLPYGPEGHKGPEYLAINPMGKFPAIVHDGKVVTECAAICMYLADVFPQAGLAPKADEKADYYRWTLFAAGPIEHAVTAKSMGWSAPQERESTIGYGNVDQTLAVLDGMLGERQFVCGHRFTAADVYVGSHVIWGTMFGTIDKTPALEAYAARMQAREAQQRANAICEAKRAESES